jgi:thioredoxin 1
MPDPLLRLLWAAVIIFVSLLFYHLLNQFLLRRMERQPLALSTTGKPVLLYFTTPTCIPCKTVQRPAIERLQRELGDGLQVVEIDAAAQPDQANRWGVLSVPTTILLDSAGKPRHINHGVAPAEKLKRQITELSKE